MHIRNKNASNLVKVLFELDENDWHGYGSETLWCEEQRENQFLIKSIPFFIKELSFNDVITSEVKGEELCFKAIKTRGGHSTYRTILLNESPQILELITSLNKLGCFFESSENLLKYPIYSFDIPREANINAAYEIFELGETLSIWEFEEAHFYKPTKN